MHAFLPEWLQIVLGILVIVGFGLAHAARRHPDVEWLRVFRFTDHLTPALRERRRRSANMHTAAEFILLGFLIPMAYFALTLMTWSDFSFGITMAVAACSLASVGIGGWIAWHGRKRG